MIANLITNKLNKQIKIIKFRIINRYKITVKKYI